MEKVKASKEIENQLAILYPRFGLLLNEWTIAASNCTTVMRNRAQGGDVSDSDSDVAQCDTDALKRTHMQFVNSVASTAEPEAVRDFNMTQTSTRLALSEMEHTCGSSP